MNNISRITEELLKADTGGTFFSSLFRDMPVGPYSDRGMVWKGETQYAPPTPFIDETYVPTAKGRRLIKSWLKEHPEIDAEKLSSDEAYKLEVIARYFPYSDSFVEGT